MGHTSEAFRTVGELVSSHPRAAEVLAQCCVDAEAVTERPLEEVCAEAGLTLRQLLAESTCKPASAPSVDWQSQPLAELVDFILVNFHAPLDLQLPRLNKLARKVFQMHSRSHHDQLRSVVHAFDALHDSMQAHMRKEESLLFPKVRDERFAELDEPLKIMQMEHESEEWLVGRIRKVTQSYTLPPEADRLWQALWRGLEWLDVSLREHTHVENDILLPRVLALMQSSP